MNKSFDPAFPGRPVSRFIPNPKLRFLDQCREVLRFKQMAARTEESYVDWIRRFILFHREPTPNPSKEGNGRGWRHPKDMGTEEVRAFLTHLAVERNVAAATQNQALNALVFLYREVIGGELGWLDGFEPAKRGARLPDVLSRAEVQAVLKEMAGRIMPGAAVLRYHSALNDSAKHSAKPEFQERLFRRLGLVRLNRVISGSSR